MSVAVPDRVRFLLDRLRSRGYEAYPVGGCVRDSLLGLDPGDWDICSSARPEELLSLFSDLRCVPTGIRHGTVTVIRGGSFEITTFRSDGAYAGHRRPEQVSFVSSLREDLARRDFTINAMALDASGNVIDLFGGRADLAAGLLRCVGNPGVRFEEDALRMLRALRFAARLGFAIEEETAAAMREKAPLLRFLSAERVKKELWGILAAPAPAALLRDFSSVLSCAVPFPFSVPETLDAAAPVPELRLALLYPDAGSVCGFLKCSKEERTRCTALRAALLSPPADRYSLVSLLASLGEADARLVLRLQPDGAEREAALDALLRDKPCLSEKDLDIDSASLQALGRSGKALGALRKELLAQVWRGEVKNERSALLTRIPPL